MQGVAVANFPQTECMKQLLEEGNSGSSCWQCFQVQVVVVEGEGEVEAVMEVVAEEVEEEVVEMAEEAAEGVVVVVVAAVASVAVLVSSSSLEPLLLQLFLQVDRYYKIFQTNQ